jgi:hypothetical protein
MSTSCFMLHTLYVQLLVKAGRPQQFLPMCCGACLGRSVVAVVHCQGLHLQICEPLPDRRVLVLCMCLELLADPAQTLITGD